MEIACSTLPFIVRSGGLCGNDAVAYLRCLSRSAKDDVSEYLVHMSLPAGIADGFLVDLLPFYPNILSIHLISCGWVIDVSPLSVCANLQTLNLYGCSGVTDVSALSDCANLHTLNLYECSGVTDVSALLGCANLHTLDLDNC